jgi:hypothetical protein
VTCSPPPRPSGFNATTQRRRAARLPRIVSKARYRRVVAFQKK